MSELVDSVDAVVIGSGFGGSIAALRLAEAGRSVVVLERGRRYSPGEFPRDVRNSDALFWRHDRPPNATGLYDVRFFSALAVVVAAGVGGGSLVYANIHIRPDAVVFDDPRWPAGTDRASLEPYFDRVAARLDIRPVPAAVTLRKRDAFRAAATALGREVFDPDQAVHWPSDEHGPGTCQFLAECEFGCQTGAKRTVDRTYLADAEQHGALVRPGRLAIAIRPAEGGYAVAHCDVRTGAEETVVGRRVVVAAGTLGTNELLLRCRDRLGALPGLSLDPPMSWVAEARVSAKSAS